MYVSLFSYVWIPESLLLWERATDSVYHLSHFFTAVTSCCDIFALVYCMRSLGSDCISSWSSSIFLSLLPCNRSYMTGVLVERT